MNETTIAASESEATVILDQIAVRYGDYVAVESADLTIQRGSFVTLLGPSGCGKTTLLRTIAGLVEHSGTIMINGRVVDKLPIHKRNIGLVFQSYALFPHRTVYDNVAFGLKYRGLPRNEISARVAEALAMVRLPDAGGKMPSQLSGGQQQRVALARSLVIEPDVLLLDEPLSALDANLREEMRIELKAIQRKLKITTIFVTHDQDEALALSDMIVVMNAGRIEQQGTSQDIYFTPATRFVADFIGQSNILPSVVEDAANGQVVINVSDKFRLRVSGYPELKKGHVLETVVRASSIKIRPLCESDEVRESECTGSVESAAFLGDTAIYVINVNGELVRVKVPVQKHVLHEGLPVVVELRSEDCVFLSDGRRIPSPAE